MEVAEDSEELEVIYLDETTSEALDEIIEDEIPDLSKLTFSKHSKSVFCGDLSKDGKFAATGGEDDNAYLWSTENGDVQFECSGHKDSIISVCFNHNGELLATGDMSGMIQVWNIQHKKLVWCYEGDDLEWLLWHPLANILISGTHSGEVYVWQVPQGNCKVLTSHGSSSSCGKLLLDGKHLLTGYEDGHVKLWDLKSTSVKWQFFDEQKSNVTSIEINSDGSLCSVAPNSQLLKMSDGKCIGTLLIDDQTDIEAHKFSNELNFLVTGSLSGQICIWDLSTQALRHQTKLNYGVTIIKDLKSSAFIGSTDGSVYVCDMRSGVFSEILTGHKASILSVCLSYNGTSLLTTSDDKTAKIFSIQ